MRLHHLLFVLAQSILCSTARAADDILIADFEGNDYGAWQVEGTAFGTAPAHGALPNQMQVQGFNGRSLVNSFIGGDHATGTLISPEFKIERRYLSFLIGGGGWKDQTCLNLMLDGKIVRTATGPNTQPGGSERLEVQFWDVAEFAGKTARLQVVDAATGGWGHINVDHIVQTDRKPPMQMTNPQREIKAEKRLLHFPVKTGAPKRNIQISVDGRAVRFFEIELADAQADWWAPLDITAWRGKNIVVQVDKLREDSQALKLIEQTDELENTGHLYRETLRPQLHFSARRGWLNDPNGMVFSQGEYHLYFQHNPYGWNWGNMHWGHAISRDLVHWEELPIAIYPHAPNDHAFSGSGVVDKENSSGWRKGDNDLLVGAYTSTGRGECIVYSNDRGRTWTEYEGNPVIKHDGRDPRLLWHAPSKQWVMALYTEDKSQGEKDKQQCIAFYTSPNLKHWTYQSRIAGFYECPDIFELPIDGDIKNKKWILTGANSDYLIGTFDGKVFTPESPKIKGHRGRGFYAAQTFINEPQNRIVQIGWLQAPSPGMPFNQAMSLPLQLSLRTTNDGPRLAWNPVEELKALRTKSHDLGARDVKPNAENILSNISGELLELRAEFEPHNAIEVRFHVRGMPIIYDVKKQELSVNSHRAPAPLRDGKIELIIYTDRTAFEIFANNGLTYIPLPVIPDAKNKSLNLSITGDSVRFHKLEVHELKSIWDIKP